MKLRLMAGIAAATMMFAAAPAAAQVTFTGNTAGCFGAACAPTTGTVTLDGLSFTSGTFNQTTDSLGRLQLGGISDGLGTFNLVAPLTGSNVFDGDTFRLLVNFTAPTGVAGDGLFSALLSGIVSTNAGGVTVDFSNSLRLFTSNAGPFSLAINDVDISSNSTTQIVSGRIQAAVPEPGTWAMMLLGFGGMGVALRRRRKLTSIAQLA